MSIQKLNFYELDEDKRLCLRHRTGDETGTVAGKRVKSSVACTLEYALKKLREDIQAIEEFKAKEEADGGLS